MWLRKWSRESARWAYKYGHNNAHNCTWALSWAKTHLLWNFQEDLSTSYWEKFLTNKQTQICFWMMHYLMAVRLCFDPQSLMITYSRNSLGLMVNSQFSLRAVCAQMISSFNCILIHSRSSFPASLGQEIQGLEKNQKMKKESSQWFLTYNVSLFCFYFIVPQFMFTIFYLICFLDSFTFCGLNFILSINIIIIYLFHTFVLDGHLRS